MTLIPEDLGFTVVILGGTAEHIRDYEAEAERLGLTDRIRFAGPRPLAHLAHYLAQADVLLSPRTKGANTPLKVYSYMLAGKAVLATNIYSHTQVLDGHSAALCEPVPRAVAARISELVRDEGLRKRLGAAAHGLAKARHTHEAYDRTLKEAYDRLMNGDA